jgi:hypothetical protein
VHGNDLLRVAAPVHVGLHSEQLPPDVADILDAEPSEARGHLEPAARARVRAERSALLVRPAGNHDRDDSAGRRLILLTRPRVLA